MAQMVLVSSELIGRISKWLLSPAVVYRSAPVRLVSAVRSARR